MDWLTSAFRGKNSAKCLQTLVDFHFPNAKLILDPTYGKGAFWKGYHKSVVGGDVDPVCAKDYVGDARHLPYQDHSIDLVVLDPPFFPGDAYQSLAGKVYDTAHILRDFSYITEFAKDDSFGIVKFNINLLLEAQRTSKLGIILKCKNIIHRTKPVWTQAMIIAEFHKLTGIYPEDMAVFVPDIVLVKDPKWKNQMHLRRQESYFLVYKW